MILEILLRGGFAQATDVSGTITTNTTWNVVGSPYIITSDVIVAEGVTF